MTKDPGLKPVFSFFGGKWRAAPRYPAPAHATVIEPFAGGAGYSLRHYRKRVILIEKDERLHGAWLFAQLASPAEILALPDLAAGESVNDWPDSIPQEARWLVGMWLNRGAASPRPTMLAGNVGKFSPAQFWGAATRQRLAAQQPLIAHWSLVHGSYESSPDVEGTWFIDPPYQREGKHYRCGAADIDFPALGAWCRARRGQVMVCENMGADWLPFRHFADIKSNRANANRRGTARDVAAVSAEAIWP